MDDAVEDDDAFLVTYLQERDEPCPRCRYNLRGLRSGVCPECGMGLRLGVAAREPYLWPWLIALLAAAGTSAIGLLFVVLVIVKGLPTAPIDRGLRGVIYTYIAVLWAPVPLIAGRRSFLKRPRRAQVGIAIAMAAIAMVMFGFVAVTVR